MATDTLVGALYAVILLLASLLAVYIFNTMSLKEKVTLNKEEVSKLEKTMKDLHREITELKEEIASLKKELMEEP